MQARAPIRLLGLPTTAVVAVVLAASAVHAQETAEALGTPYASASQEQAPRSPDGENAPLTPVPRRVARVALELALSTAGVAGAFALGSAACDEDARATEWGCFGITILYGSLGLAVGLPLGVWLGGLWLGGSGGLGWTYLGAAGGVSAMGLLLRVGNNPVIVALAISMPFVGATLAFELSSDASERRALRAPHRITAGLAPTAGGAVLSLAGDF